MNETRREHVWLRQTYCAVLVAVDVLVRASHAAAAAGRVCACLNGHSGAG